MYEYARKAFKDDELRELAQDDAHFDRAFDELGKRKKARKNTRKPLKSAAIRLDLEDDEPIELNRSGIQLPERREIGDPIRALLADTDECAPYARTSQSIRNDPKIELAKKVLEFSIAGQNKLQEARSDAEKLAETVFNKHQHDIEQQQMQTQLHMAHLEQERKRKQFEEEQKLEELKMSLLSPSSDARLAVPADTTAYVAVKIRTNGVHEHVWQICKSEKLERLVERYCTRHQVAKGNVRFEFDGERMNENATAEDADLCEGDLIDVNIPATCYEAAMNALERENPHDDYSSSKVSLKTRLNGTLEHIWKLNRREMLSKLVSACCSKYNLDPHQATFEFDGFILQHNRTCAELELESDDIIDVKVPAHVFSVVCDSYPCSNAQSSNSLYYEKCSVISKPHVTIQRTAVHFLVNMIDSKGVKRGVMVQGYTDDHLEKLLKVASDSLYVILSGIGACAVMDGRQLDICKTIKENGISESSEVEYLQKITIEIRDSDNHVHLTVFTHDLVEKMLRAVTSLLHLEYDSIQLRNRMNGQLLSPKETLQAAGITNGTILDMYSIAVLTVLLPDKREIKVKVNTSDFPEVMMRHIAVYLQQPLSSLHFGVKGRSLDPLLPLKVQDVNHKAAIHVSLR